MRTLARLFTMLLLCALWPAAARADAVLFLASEPPAADLYAALDIELRGFGTLLVQRPDGRAGR